MTDAKILTKLQNLAASGTVADAREIVKIGKTHPAAALEALENMGCPGIVPQLVAAVALNDRSSNKAENTLHAMRMLIDSVPGAASNIRPKIETGLKQLVTALTSTTPEFNQP